MGQPAIPCALGSGLTRDIRVCGQEPARVQVAQDRTVGNDRRSAAEVYVAAKWKAAACSVEIVSRCGLTAPQL